MASSMAFRGCAPRRMVSNQYDASLRSSSCSSGRCLASRLNATAVARTASKSAGGRTFTAALKFATHGNSSDADTAVTMTHTATADLIVFNLYQSRPQDCGGGGTSTNFFGKKIAT